MAEGDRERALRDELARLSAGMADGERNANDVAAKARRRREIEAELGRLGAGGVPDGQTATTYRDPR